MINNQALPETHAVQCLPIGSLTMITAGDDTSGAKASVSNEKALTAKSVTFHGLAGFTGSYAQGIQGAAQTTMNGYTYIIRGSAEGFNQNDPALRTVDTFTMQVAC